MAGPGFYSDSIFFADFGRIRLISVQIRRPGPYEIRDPGPAALTLMLPCDFLFEAIWFRGVEFYPHP